MQRALNTSEAGKEAKEQLAARVKKYQEEINVQQEDIKKLKFDLENKIMPLSESAGSSKVREYQQRLKKFERFTKDAQNDLQVKDTEFTRKIIEDTEKIIQEFGHKNGYIFIFVKNEGTLYTDDKADVTEEVLKLFNAIRKNK